MSDERRYHDSEIKQILDLAIRGEEVNTPTPTATEGLTLAELQDVGRDIGLDPGRVAQAVTAFEGRGELVPRGTTLGMPTSVGRIVELPRAITDREWDVLVSELRKTFRAKGRVTSHGSLREWTNGNLHAFVEPTESGHQLRMTTFKGDAMGVNAAAAFLLAFAFMILVVLLGKEDPGARFIVPVMFALAGILAGATNVIGLPRWANEREDQMEYIADRVRALISSGSDDD